MGAWLCLISQGVWIAGTVFADSIFAGASGSSTVCCTVRLTDAPVCVELIVSSSVSVGAVVI